MQNLKKPKGILLPRREFIAGAIGGVSAMIVTPSAFAKSKKSEQGVRSLKLFNLHTHEEVSVDYWVDGVYQPEALAQIDMLMRDHRTNDVCPIDTNLVELLRKVQQGIGRSGKPIEIVSGYRSAATNEMLRAKRKHSGVAKKSFHMLGKATDIKVPGRNTSEVYKAAVALKGGGVGYYGSSKFIHMDVGKVRTWGAKKSA